MTRPFFLRLKDYYVQVGAVLRGEAGVASIFPNTTDVGMARERIYAEVLRLHLPSSCNVMFGGFLFGMDGSESKQLDVIVTNDLSLQFNFHNRSGEGKSFSCIDGTIAVVAVKSSLKAADLGDALENLASIPAKQPLGNRFVPSLRTFKGYDEWPYKIVYASDGVSLQTALKTIEAFYADRREIETWRRPDLIHVAGKYIIDRSSVQRHTRDGDVVPAQAFHGVPETTDVYGLFNAVAQCQRIALLSRYLDYSYGEMLDSLLF